MRPDATPRRRKGFTLLEVLAAVALLGIVYVTLAGVAMQGLRGEGVAQRRLAASLLADRRLADLERDLAVGVTPPEGRSEEESDEFVVSLEVRPFEAPVGFYGDDDVASTRQSPLTTPSRDQAPVVMEIDLVVSWLEGDREMSVERTTFGYNAAAMAAFLPAPEDAGGGGGGEDAP